MTFTLNWILGTICSGHLGYQEIGPLILPSCSRYFAQKPNTDNDAETKSISDEEDDNDDKEEDKEEKKSFKEKLQAIQEVTAMVQNALGYAAHFCEAVKNTFNFSVPFLSWLAIIILTIVSIFLFFIPCRVIIMLWGINKFSRQLIMPNTEPNNELLDFLSRVPNDEMLKDSRELKLMHEENVQNKRPASKKRNWTMWCDILTNFLCTLLLPL